VAALSHVPMQAVSTYMLIWPLL